MENEKMERQTIETEECQCCRHKATPRNKEELRQMQNRLKRMIGQLNGIGKMLEDNRYCGDILIQVAAVEKSNAGIWLFNSSGAFENLCYRGDSERKYASC